MWHALWRGRAVAAAQALQVTPPQQTRQDCRACPSTAAVTQARQAATPSRPTATQNVDTLWTAAYDYMTTPKLLH